MKVEDLNTASLLFSQLYSSLAKPSGDLDFEESLKEAKKLTDKLGEGLNNGVLSFDELSSSESSVEKFKKNLTKMGASAFMAVLNQEKIEAKIEAKKEELKKQLGLDEQGIVGKSADEIKELKAQLEDMLSQYRKELLSQMQNNLTVQKQQNLAGATASRSNLQMLLNTL